MPARKAWFSVNHSVLSPMSPNACPSFANSLQNFFVHHQKKNSAAVEKHSILQQFSLVEIIWAEWENNNISCISLELERLKGGNNFLKFGLCSGLFVKNRPKFCLGFFRLLLFFYSALCDLCDRFSRPIGNTAYPTM
jgi:hypothetical protein